MHDQSTAEQARIKRRARGLWLHVQPIFLLPGAAMSGFGALLADEFALAPAALHATAVCLAIYVAHLKDGYVDYYIRGEDDCNPLEPAEIRVAIGVAAVLFGCCLAILWLLAGGLVVTATMPLIALGYFHAPLLDTRPVAETVDYPLGIALATAGGYATQTGTVSVAVGAVCLVLFLLLAAINIMLDRTDVNHDRRVAKQTLPVVLGPHRAQRVAWGLIATSLLILCVSSLVGPLPQSALLAGVMPAAVTVGVLVQTPDLKRLVALFIGATYVFAAALFLAIRIDGYG